MKLRTAAFAAAALTLSTAPAQAADHTVKLSAATPKVEWEGAPHVSRWLPVYDEASREAMPCKSARPCEYVHVQVMEAGKMSLGVEGLEGTGGTTDVDIFLYKSDASETQGEKIAVGSASGPDTVTVAKAQPGYYLMVVDYYHSYNSGYKGKATFVSSVPAVTPAPAVPAAPATPATPAKPAKSNAAKKKAAAAKKRKACQKKAKKIKNKKKRSKALKRCKKIK